MEAKTPPRAAFGATPGDTRPITSAVSVEFATRAEVERADIDIRAEEWLLDPAEPFPTRSGGTRKSALNVDRLETARPEAPTRLSEPLPLPLPLQLDSARFRRVLENEAGARISAT